MTHALAVAECEQGLFGTGGWVPGDYIKAVGEGAGDPAAADDATAKRGKSLDIGNERHV